MVCTVNVCYAYIDRQGRWSMACLLRAATVRQVLAVELGCGSGSTCWRRFQQWAHLGGVATALRGLVKGVGMGGRY